MSTTRSANGAWQKDRRLRVEVGNLRGSVEGELLLHWWRLLGAATSDTSCNITGLRGLVFASRSDTSRNITGLKGLVFASRIATGQLAGR